MANPYSKGVYFSPSTASFYLLGLKSSYEKGDGWPEDAVAVTDSVFNEYGLSSPPPGKVRGSMSGAPCWLAIP